MENIENSFRDLIASLQTAKLYTVKHPMFEKSIEKAFVSIGAVLKYRPEFIIGIIGEELAFEKEIFFDLSKMLKPVIFYLKERGIEKIAFYRGLNKEELVKFITFLAMPKEEFGHEAEDYLSLAGIKNINVGKILASSGVSISGSEEYADYLNLYEGALEKVSQSVAKILNTEMLDHLTLKFAMNNIAEGLSRGHQEFFKLVTFKRYDPATSVHLLNVSILAMHFSSKLGFDREDILDIAVAALFHDVGKLYISRKILRKAEKLTDEEFMKIKSHANLGASILLDYVDVLGILPVVVAFEHHLKYNLKGYPALAFPREPHLASLIVAICDVYDALSQRRGYKVDYSPDMIYNVMEKERGSSFHPELVDKFFKIMGVWPIGSIVSLNDGRVALVLGENEEDIFRPKIEVIAPEEKKELVDLKEKKDIKIEKYLNPWKEGKDYLHLLNPKNKLTSK